MGQDEKDSLGGLYGYFIYSYSGFILLILPFTFAYISEFQKEAAKIMGGNLFLMQQTKPDLCDGCHDYIRIIFKANLCKKFC